MRMRFTVLKFNLFLVVLITTILFGVVTDVKAQQTRIDNDCLRFLISNPSLKLSDAGALGLRISATNPSYVSADSDKNGDFRLNIEEVNDVCSFPADERYKVEFASYTKCKEAGLTCDYTTHYCVQVTDTTLGGSIDYECDPNGQLKIDPSKCGTCDPLSQVCNDPFSCTPVQECKMMSQIAYYSAVANGRGFTPSIWACQDKEQFINLFGLNMGPFDQAVLKIIRTILAGAFAIIGVWSGIVLVFAIWGTTQRTPESFEQIQKTVINALLGLVFMIAGFFVIQFLSGLFGISGNIFAFTYTP